MTTRRGPRRQGVVLGVACAFLAALVPAQTAMATTTCEVQGSTARVTTDGYTIVQVLAGAIRVSNQRADEVATCDASPDISVIDIQAVEAPEGVPFLTVATDVPLERGFSAEGGTPLQVRTTGFHNPEVLLRGPAFTAVLGQQGDDVLVDTGGPVGHPEVVMVASRTAEAGVFCNCISRTSVLDARGNATTGGPVTKTVRLAGHDGDDRLFGGLGADLLRGGDGSDTVLSSGDRTNDDVNCGGRTDQGEADALDALTNCEFTAPQVAVAGSPVTVAEDSGKATVTVTLDRDLVNPVTVTAETVDGTAKAGTDYTGVKRDITFQPGGTKAVSFDVPIADDGVYTGPRTLAVDLGSLDAATTDGEVVITDDEPVDITATAGPATVQEGESAQVPVELDKPAAEPVEGKLAAGDGTPVAFRIDAGAGKTTVAVPVAGNDTFDGDRTLPLRLSDLTGAKAGQDGTLTVEDDEASPSVTVPDAAVGEGGTKDVVLTLSGKASVPITRTLAGQGGTAAPTDYTLPASVTFAAGTTTAAVTVSGAEDDVDEQAETFTLRTTDAPQGVTDTAGTVTIEDTDPTPTVSGGEVTGTEGETVQVPVVLSGASSRTQTVGVRLAHFGGSAKEVTIPAGATTASVAMVVPQDGTYQGADRAEPVELFGASSGLVVGADGKLTIVDDDPVPTVRVTEASVTEGGKASVELVLSGPAAFDVERSVSTKAATAGAGDFTAIDARGVTFPQGATLAYVELTTAQDALDEPDETLSVVPSGDDDTAGTITILDDDASPVLSAADAETTEGDPATVDLSMSSPSGGEVEATVNGVPATIEAGRTTGSVSVPVAEDDIDNGDRQVPLVVKITKGLATAGEDKALTVKDDDDAPVVNAGDGSGTEGGTADVQVALTRASSKDLSVEVGTEGATPVTAAFEAGETRTTVRLPVPGDEVFQGGERRQPIALSDPSDGVTKGLAGQLTITDDEAVPAVTVKDVSVDEGATTDVELVLSPKAAADITRTVSTRTGTAGEADFTAITGREVTFEAGRTSATVPVAATEDDVDEPVETFQVLSSGADDTAGTVTLEDTDETPVLTAKDAGTTEGTPAEVDVVLSGASSQPVRAKLNGRPVELAAGAVRTIVAVPAPDNDTYDGDRVVPLALTDVPDSVKAGEDGKLTVRDDEPVPTVSVADAAVDEGASVDLQLTLSGRASVPVTRRPTASSEDVQLAGDEVTFAPGQTTATLGLSAEADGTDEPDEAVEIAPGRDGDTAGTVTVADRDATPSVTAADATGTEGGTAEVDLTLSGPSSRELGIDVGTQGVGAVRATFAPGRTTASVELPVPDDEVFQGTSRTQALTLAGPSDGLSAGKAGELTIADDEGAPAATVRDAKLGEGEEAEVRIELARAASTDVVRTVSTRTGTAGAGDFTGIDAREVTFPAGTTTRTVTVQAEQDGTDEPEETFALVLGGAPAGVTDTDGTVTITDDDEAPRPGGAVAGSSQSAPARPAGAPKVVDTATGVKVICTPFEIALLDARKVGRSVQLTGYALPRLAGRTVAITADGRPAGTAEVGPNGLFRLKVRPALRYGAKVGGAVARGLRLERRLQITKVVGTGSQVQVSGRVALPRGQRLTSLVLTKQDDQCNDVSAGRLKLSKAGRFSVELDRPSAGQVLRLYRLQAKTRTGRVYSVPVVVLP